MKKRNTYFSKKKNNTRESQILIVFGINSSVSNKTHTNLC